MRHPVDAFRRFGLSLVEFLLVIAIFAFLIGLVLVGIQHSRETANRLACTNNLKQIGLGLHLHHDTHLMFPSNGGFDNQTIMSVSGQPIRVSTTDFTTRQTYYWGVGDPSQPPQRQQGSWLYAILPFIDHQGIYEDRSWTAPVKIYICPSRRLPFAYPVTRKDTYGAYEGGGWQWGKTDYAGNGLILAGNITEPKSTLNVGQVTDGTSQTILAGEKAFDPSVQTPTTWYWDLPFFLGGGGSASRTGVNIVRDVIGNTYKKNWGAIHPSGAQFVYVDGSVRLLGYDLSPLAMSALLTPNSGEINVQ